MARVSIEAATLARAKLGRRRAAGWLRNLPDSRSLLNPWLHNSEMRRPNDLAAQRHMAMTTIRRKITSTTAPPIMAVQNTGELVIEGPCAMGMW